MTESQGRGHSLLWSGRSGFILACAGSAIGLGNIWKFPYITGENGGGAFVLVYLVCILLIGAPLMMAEIMIGRHGARNPVASFQRLARASNAHPGWQATGWLGLVAAFLLLSFYSVIGGWTLAYLFKALSMIDGGFRSLSTEQVRELFANLASSPGLNIFWHTIFMLLVISVIQGGVRNGIERAIKVLMPALFLLLLLLLLYALFSPSFMAGVRFLLWPDFGMLSPVSVLTALGHAFFSLGVGISVMLAYGSFLPRDISIPQATAALVVLDTVVALVAGVIIFTLVFQYQLEVGAGPGLIFETLPLAFSRMAGGNLVAVTFFFLLVVAAWSSAISLLEPLVERMEEHRGVPRLRATWLAGAAVWLVGIPSALSFNLLGSVRTPQWLGNKNFFDSLDFLVSNLLLPIGGIAIALFAGWILSAETAGQELAKGRRDLLRLWQWLMRYLVPCAVAVILISPLF